MEKIGYPPRELNQYRRCAEKMMLDPKLLTLIQCPISRQPLQIAPPELVDRINKKIAAGQLRDRDDVRVSDALEQGLVSQEGGYLYPVRGGIPILVAEAAIELGDGS